MAKAKAEIRRILDNFKNSFIRLVAAQKIYKIAEKRKEVEGGDLKAAMLRQFADYLWEKHAAPKKNPRYGVFDERGRLDVSAIFLVKKQFKFNLSERDGDMGIAEHLKADLMDYAGLSDEKATALVQNELHVYESIPVLLDRLIYGSYSEGDWVESTDIEKAAGGKILDYILANNKKEFPTPLTDQEREAVRQFEKEAYRLQPGFFERLYTYCEDAEQVYKVLKIVDPTHYFAYGNLGESETPEGKVRRLKEEAAALMDASQLG